MGLQWRSHSVKWANVSIYATHKPPSYGFKAVQPALSPPFGGSEYSTNSQSASGDLSPDTTLCHPWIKSGRLSMDWVKVLMFVCLFCFVLFVYLFVWHAFTVRFLGGFSVLDQVQVALHCRIGFQSLACTTITSCNPGFQDHLFLFPFSFHFLFHLVQVPTLDWLLSSSPWPVTTRTFDPKLALDIREVVNDVVDVEMKTPALRHPFQSFQRGLTEVQHNLTLLWHWFRILGPKDLIKNKTSPPWRHLDDRATSHQDVDLL